MGSPKQPLAVGVPLRVESTSLPRPADVCNTVYHLLDIDPDTAVYDKANRPLAISHGGEPIREILV